MIAMFFTPVVASDAVHPCRSINVIGRNEPNRNGSRHRFSIQMESGPLGRAGASEKSADSVGTRLALGRAGGNKTRGNPGEHFVCSCQHDSSSSGR